VLTDADVDRLLVFAEELGGWAVDRISAHRPTQVATKSGPADLVTETDREVETHVRSEIAARWPGHQIVGEELGASAPSATGEVWYVDPVDGTTNYAHGLPWTSFSLALADPTGPVVAVVADPDRREIFSAARGRGARCNGEPVRCSPATDLAGEVVLTEWAGHRPWPGMEQMLARLSAAQVSTRIMGSSALSLASAGAGRAAGVVLGSFNTWDVLAGVLIAQEAGARLMGRDGEALPAVPDDAVPGLLAAGPAVAEQVHRTWTA
jgi:fructose-1,6-bisphosphatase/inositol monophosphatase family enzyme